MSWFRLCAAIASAAVVSGCGFQPIAASRGGDATSSIVLSGVSVAADDDHVAYTLRQEIMRHIAIDPSAPYTLAIEVDFEQSGIAVTAKDAITRYILSADASFALDPMNDDGDHPPISGAIEAETSLNATSSVLSTDVLAAESRLNLARDLSRRLLTRMRQLRRRDIAL